MRQVSNVWAALTGMLMLAVAMGIGRFAFTPPPMMGKDAGCSPARAGCARIRTLPGPAAGGVAALLLWVSGIYLHSDRS